MKNDAYPTLTAARIYGYEVRREQHRNRACTTGRAALAGQVIGHLQARRGYVQRDAQRGAA